MMLPIRDGAPASGLLTSVRPKGQIVKLAILKAWRPNGIVMIRTHMMIPARHQRIVAQRPAKTSQMMLRRIRITARLGRPYPAWTNGSCPAEAPG